MNLYQLKKLKSTLKDRKMNELEKIFESDFEDCFITAEECFEVLRNKEYTVTVINEDEDYNDYSIKVEWYTKFIVQKR